MKHHSELINTIAAKIGARRYVEIGVCDKSHNFDKINIAQKVGVDPDPGVKTDMAVTSDTFFKAIMALEGRADLVLVDGLHHKDQVRRDILNAWTILNPGGAIVVHDANPPTERTTCVPRGAQREWCGDVYKVITHITWPAAESEFFTVNMDYGCTVIRKRKQGADLVIAEGEITWAEFDANRADLLKLVSTEEALKLIESWT